MSLLLFLQHIETSMRDLGWDVEVSSSRQRTPDGEVDFHNVIATLDPDAPRRLVLACHYDSKKTPRGFLGATDSAVPCAQMINLAHTMRRDLGDDRERVRAEHAFMRYSVLEPSLL